MKRACLALGLVLACVVGAWAQNTVNLLNTRYNAESTGNVLTLPFTAYWQTTTCNDSGAWAADWHHHTPTVDAPSPSCASGMAGAVATYGNLVFDDSATEYISRTFQLPSDWTGALDLRLVWISPATTGNVVWQVRTVCRADGEASDPDAFTLNAAQIITDATKGTAYLLNDATLSSVTTTGCAAGETLFLKILRDPTHASDTIADVAQLISVAMTYRRAI